MKLTDVISDIIEKAKGGDGGFRFGKPEAVAPSGDEDEKEKNKANSGTHPENKGKDPSKGGTPYMTGEQVKKKGDEAHIGPAEGPGAAPHGHDPIKHEGGGSGPNHPGTATTTQKQQKSEDDPDLLKGRDEEEEGKEEEKGEGEEEKEEKSLESGEVFLDIDEFAAEITKSVYEKVMAEFEEPIEKAHQSEYIGAGLAKSLYSLIERVEELEKSKAELEAINAELSKAVTNIAKSGSVRKSLLSGAEKKYIDNPSMSGEKLNLSKSEISSKLLDMQMAGTPGVDQSLVLRFDAVGDTQLIPAAIRAKIGIE